MIIGKNTKINPMNNPNYNNTNNTNNINSTIHADVTNKNEMNDKSFAMLQERYKNGLITLEEFTKQCNKLNKLRNK